MNSRYFTRTEILIWSISIAVISAGFFLFDGTSRLSYIASLIGVTSLTLNAKGNPLGQLLTVVFSILYGIISYRSAYYGEMITYLGMTTPMALAAMISWLRHPAQGRKMEVQINRLSREETRWMILLALVVTGGFYFILRAFRTANLGMSTLSVLTSFLAAYLTYRRSPYYATCYAANDLVLIVLWLLMIPETTSAISMVLCFSAFAVNDLYGFVNWNRMERRQKVVTNL